MKIKAIKYGCDTVKHTLIIIALFLTIRPACAVDAFNDTNVMTWTGYVSDPALYFQGGSVRVDNPVWKGANSNYHLTGQVYPTGLNGFKQNGPILYTGLGLNVSVGWSNIPTNSSNLLILTGKNVSGKTLIFNIPSFEWLENGEAVNTLTEPSKLDKIYSGGSITITVDGKQKLLYEHYVEAGIPKSPPASIEVPANSTIELKFYVMQVYYYGTTRDPRYEGVSTWVTKNGINYISSIDARLFKLQACSLASVNFIKSIQSINFSNPGSKVFGAAAFDLGATASSKLPVTYSIVSGGSSASISGSKLTIAGSGTVTVRASQLGNDEFSPAPDVDQTFTISKATATVTLSSTSTTFTGLPILVTATTNPPGLNVIITYNGSTTPPTNVGTYTIVGRINDPRFQGVSP